MDVRIGMTNVARELSVDLPDESRDDLLAQLEGKLADAGAVVRLVDRKGKVVIIPAGKVAYVEIGTAESERRIGFGGG